MVFNKCPCFSAKRVVAGSGVCDYACRVEGGVPLE